MPLPASVLLQPDCPVRPAWAVFDPEWYFDCYGDHLPAGIARTRDALLQYYLGSGCQLGHSPSPFFDEIYYLAGNPGICALVKAGRYGCGFDHYCQIGHRFHSGHWLFDPAFYGSLYDDMSQENLDAHGLYGGYDHYLRSGQFEHRQPHLLFDSRFFAACAIAAGDDARLVAQNGPFSHFLTRLQSNAAELPPSIYFDPGWVMEHHQHALNRERTGSAIAHYLRGGGSFDPVPEFSEEFYRQSNPDVRAAIDAGVYASGYRHFLQTGVFEFRQPSPGVDLMFYRDANAMVRGDLNTGEVRDAFAHLRAIGRKAGFCTAPPAPDSGISEAAARELFIAKARDNFAVVARRKIDFSINAGGTLAVIMVMSGKIERSLLALASLRGNIAGDVQLILIDKGSTEPIEQYVTGAQILRLERNTGHPEACNLALRQVTVGLVLFLDSDVELAFGAMEAAIARMRSAPEIAAVGGKVIRAHGMLREAGCIIWQDGATQGYMQAAAPDAGEANFVREVDFCSRLFLLCRSAAVRNAGGFDADFSPGPFADADLCVRLAASGYRIMYDPAIVLRHYGGEGGPAEALRLRGQRIFVSKHANFLQTRPVNAPENVTAARSPDRGQKKILFIEDIVPLRHLGAGYVRANDIVHAIAAAGHAVSVFPVNDVDFDMTGIDARLPESTEVLHDRDIGRLGEFLQSRPGYYDLIWICRTHNLDQVLPICLAAGIDLATTPLVLDTEAIGAVRDAGRARIAGAGNFDFADHLRRELENARHCRHCIAVNEAEAGLLRGVGLPLVSVVGTMRCPDPTPNDFAAREGLLFVGGIHQEDSPNLDALFWYLEEVLPALREQMAEVPVLNFAGYVAPGIDLSPFAEHPQIKIHGAAMSLRSHYENNRLFIAPTRFAAGTPYKMVEAAAFGLPIVATDLLAGQLNWRDGKELLAAQVGDAKHFAAQIARLYGDALIWEQLRKRALDCIAAENTAEAFNQSIAILLQDVLASGGDAAGAARLTGRAFASTEAQNQRSLFCAGGQPAFSSEKEGLT